MFLYKIDMGSSIHPVHVDVYHKGNFNGQMNFWQQSGASFNLDQLLDYDPYLGRIVQPSKNENNNDGSNQ